VGGLVGEINRVFFSGTNSFQNNRGEKEREKRRGRERKKKERSCNIPIFIPVQILNLT
jgi:hypothetical protein